MKRALILITIGLIVFGAAVLVSYAQDDYDIWNTGKEKVEKMLDEPTESAKGELKTAAGQLTTTKVAAESMQMSMVATTDGAIVVMAGNKLIKFDEDLNKVKEVEIMMQMLK